MEPDVRGLEGDKSVKAKKVGGLLAERAKAARLESERTFSERVKFPRDIADRQSDPKINELIFRESALFRARRESVDTNSRFPCTDTSFCEPGQNTWLTILGFFGFLML